MYTTEKFCIFPKKGGFILITLRHEDEFNNKNIKIRDWSVSSHPHTHNFFELMYVTNGTIMHSLNGSPLEPISKGSYIFIDLGNFHNFICEDATIVNISFSAKLIDKHIDSCKDIRQLISSSKFSLKQSLHIPFPVGTVLNDESGEVLNLIRMMQRQIPINSPTSYAILRHHMIALLLLIIQPYYDSSGINDVSTLSKKLLSFIEEDYSKSDVLSIASQQLNYSATTLSLQFQKDFGITFKEYLCKYRLDEAKNLLETTSKKISEISQTVGYQDHKYFSRIFKDYTGITPREYRQRISLPIDIPIQNL